MKFSLQTLVLLTLICALAVNYFILDRKTKHTFANQLLTLKKLESSRFSLEKLRSWRGDQTDHLAAYRSQQKDLALAQDKLVSEFDKFAEAAGQLKIDESQFSIKQIPHYFEPSKFSRSYNIFVPASMKLAVKVYCYEKPFVDGFNRFSNTNDATIELPVGKSELTFCFEKCHDHDDGSFNNVIALLLDGEIKESWIVKGQTSWYGCVASSTPLPDQKDVSEFSKKLKLIPRFEPTGADHKLELQIVDLSGRTN